MPSLDEYLAALGGEATYGPEAAARLERRLAAEMSPRASARRQNWAAMLAFVSVASLAGGAVGALIEAQTPPSTTALLPASQTGTAAALLFGGEG